MGINLRDSLNAISDVVTNRPRPLRQFDQIFMKAADMLLQTEHVGRHFDGRRVVCIGDGDAIGLCLVHLHNQGLVEKGPKSVHVLDFDERVVMSVKRFAETHKLEGRVSAELYNVIDPLPRKHWHKFDGFYTNPPFGASNGGRSVQAFALRGDEAVGADGVGCLVIADDRRFEWSRKILLSTEQLMLRTGYVIAELVPEFHRYHLDDVPDLTSCSLVVRRTEPPAGRYASKPLDPAQFADFYGRKRDLQVKYVRDLTQGSRFQTTDYEFEYLDGGQR
jgi:N4-bis(aminopropyl)spermidine synthase